MHVLSGYDLLKHYRSQQPELLAQAIMRAMGAGGVQWRDPADPARPWSNLDYLRPGGQAATAWRAFWPEDDHPLSWDAIGRVQMGRVGWSWLMVRALAHPNELAPCPAPPESAADERLRHAVAFAQQRFHADNAPSWLDTHCRMALPLAAFAHQRAMGSCVRLLFAHFYDRSPDIWQEPLVRFRDRMGLTGQSVFERHVHHVFLPMPEEV